MGITIDLASTNLSGIAGSKPDGDSTGRANLEGITVLLVEDQALIAMELQFVLEAAGAEVIGPVISLAAAVLAVEEDGFDIAILDIDLGGKDVFPAADILVERGLPFVFHTGHGNRADLAASYEAPVCIKPLPSETMVAVLSRMV